MSQELVAGGILTSLLTIFSRRNAKAALGLVRKVAPKVTRWHAFRAFWYGGIALFLATCVYSLVAPVPESVAIITVGYLLSMAGLLCARGRVRAWLGKEAASCPAV